MKKFPRNEVDDRILMLSKDAAEFLRHAIARKKRTRSSYSLRALARDSGISAAMLSQLINGKRALSSSRSLQLMKRLGLSPFEEIYFSALLDLARAASSSAKSELRQRLGIIRQEARSDRVDAEVFSRMRIEWHHLAAYSCCGLDGFTITTANISRQLGIPLSKAKDALENLLRLGWLKREGRTGISVVNRYRNLSDARNTKEYGRYRLQIAEKSCRRISAPGLPDAFNVGMMTFDPEQIRLVQDECVHFYHRLREISDRCEKVTAVYAAYFHFFEPKE